MKDLTDELTVFVMTVGDQRNFSNAMQCLRQQTVKFRLNVIEGVAPLSAAFAEMQKRCETRYYVQVDEDMMLFPHAVATLFDRIVLSPQTVAIVAAPLWDCDVNMPIHGVKIYRHDIVRQFPYQDTLSSHITQMNQLREAGYETEELPLAPWNCLGEHGKYYTPRTIFARWQKVLWKQQRYPTLRWVKPWPQKLLERYLETGSELHLWALMGAIAGIVGELPPDRAQDFREGQPDFDRLAKYFGVHRDEITWRPSRSARLVSFQLRVLSWLNCLWRRSRTSIPRRPQRDDEEELGRRPKSGLREPGDLQP